MVDRLLVGVVLHMLVYEVERGIVLDQIQNCLLVVDGSPGTVGEKSETIIGPVGILKWQIVDVHTLDGHTFHMVQPNELLMGHLDFVDGRLFVHENELAAVTHQQRSAHAIEVQTVGFQPAFVFLVQIGNDVVGSSFESAQTLFF